MQRDLQLLSVGMAIRTFGAAMYAPFLALFLYVILNVGYLDIGIIFLGLGAVQLPFGLAGGLWTDRVGRRRLILLSLVAEATISAALAYAFDVRSLLLAVTFGGAGGCVLSATGPAFSAYIADFTAGSERTLGFTWYRISFNAGYAAGVAIGGGLVALIGFPGILLLAAIVIGGAAVFLLLVLAPSPYDVGLGQGLAPRPTSTANGSAPRSLRESFSLLAHDRVALLAASALALVYLTSSQWNVIFSLFVHNKLGIPYSILGVGLALNGLVVVFGQSFTTHRVLGMRHTTIAILGALLYAVSFLLLGVSALLVLAPVAVFFVATIVLTFGENLESIPTSTLPSNLAASGEVGAYNGAFNAFLSAAAIGATFLGGAVLAGVANPLWEWVILVVPSVPGMILLRVAARRIPGGADRA